MTSTDTTLTQCAHCRLYFPRNELDGYVEEKREWARFIPDYDGPLWCLFCEYDGDDSSEDVAHCTPGVKSPDGPLIPEPPTDLDRKAIIKAFKKTICKEMGLTNSSLIAHQTLPIAWDIARVLRYNPYEFVRSIGYSDTLLQEKGYPTKPVAEF